jgi:hypothetical protein
MEITRFTAANGREVVKVMTDSGATGYIDASIPLEAIEAWIRRLDANLKRPISRWRRTLRQERRRTFRPIRTRTRRRRTRIRIVCMYRRGRPLIPRR